MNVSQKNQFSRDRIAFWTIFRKEMIRVGRIWTQTILPSVMTMGLYFAIFGKLMGSRIGLMGGVSYLNYLTPGLIMMSIMTNAYTNVVSSFFGAKFHRFIEEILIAPVSNSVIILGYISGGIVRGLIVGFLVLCVAQLFGVVLIQHPGFLFGIGALTAIAFSLGGFINGLYAKKFDDVTLVPTFLLTPLIYLGGIFFSIEALSNVWRTATYCNPIFYIVNAFRYSMLGQSEVPLYGSVSILVGLVLVLYFWALILLKKGVGLKS